MQREAESPAKADMPGNSEDSTNHNGIPRKNGRISPLKRGLLYAGAVLAVGAGIAIVTWYYRYHLTHVDTDDAFIAAHISLISPRVAGHVMKVNVDDNQHVRTGDLLVELDPRDFELSLASAKAALQTAASNLESATANVDLTRATSDAAIQKATAGVEVAQAAVKDAQAKVTAARSGIRQTEAHLHSTDASIQQSTAQVQAAQAQARLDQQEWDRVQKLFETSAAPPIELDRSREAAHVSAANLDAARKRVSAAEANQVEAQAALGAAKDGLTQAESMLAEAVAKVDQAKADLADANSAPQELAVNRAKADMARSQVEQAKVAVDQAVLQLSYTKVHAPVDGFVTSRTVEPGQYLQVGQPMLSIVPENVWVIANYKETDLTHVRPGQPVTIRVDMYPNVVFRGRVDSLQAGTGAAFSLLPPENATGNYVKVVQRVPVKIVFDPPPHRQRYFLAPGMSVVPTVNTTAAPRHAPATQVAEQ
jgi:membrane fusion protein, multidrug efflux system